MANTKCVTHITSHTKCFGCDRSESCGTILHIFCAKELGLFIEFRTNSRRLRQILEQMIKDATTREYYNLLPRGLQYSQIHKRFSQPSQKGAKNLVLSDFSGRDCVLIVSWPQFKYCLCAFGAMDIWTDIFAIIIQEQYCIW